MSAAIVTPLIPDPVAAPIERPEYRAYEKLQTLDGVKLRPGVWHHGNKQDKETGDPVPFDEWLCGPLNVDAITRSEGQDSDYGKLLRFRNQDGKWLTWAMPNELLAGRPDAILAVLLSMGLDVDYKRRNQVCQYIANQHPKHRVIAATSTGWHTPELFIMPRRHIGTGDAIFQSETANGDDYRSVGTLERWQSTIAAWCEGNPLMILGVCTALAGPLLFHVKRQGGGFHYRGDSSIGKSTAMYAANSVWGHGEDFKRTWRATGNGLEGVAAQRNDTLLSLDEIGEANPREIGAVVYSIANGSGKTRASRTGAARAAKRWRVMALSNGEESLSQMIAKGGGRACAGQEVRLLDIPARRTHGIFDNLHGMVGGRELSDAVKLASHTDYGHAGPEFVRLLVESGEAAKLTDWLAAMADQFPNTSGQEGRAAERFALVALAGELAVKYGLLPLPKGHIGAAMIELFVLWRAGRGEGPGEDRQILKSIADFIARHGDTRFSGANDSHGEARDRAGYWEDAPTGRLFLFNRPGLEEAAKGYDLGRVVLALDSVGAIAKREAGKHQHKKCLPDGSKPRLYWIDPTKLEPET
ncbi:DUF927 domain-containing protein [Pseudomonas sp. TMP25]|uniref:DUF927 domain-containing protein n=1 Tax=Pseudomonas sp. TMP25 TaxID=3136561 RepID=UPI0031010B88